jgi:hypothetical protein
MLRGEKEVPTVKRKLPFPAIDDKNIFGVRSQESEIRMKSERARTFQDLIVWQKTHQFVLSVYRSTESFPKRETSG